MQRRYAMSPTDENNADENNEIPAIYGSLEDFESSEFRWMWNVGGVCNFLSM